MLPLELPFSPMRDNLSKKPHRQSHKAAILTRGVVRLFKDLGCGCLTEFPLPNSRRVDIITLSTEGIFSIIEVKSSVQDFKSDSKWQFYLPYCDRFYFAVSENFPLEILPRNHGIIIADKFSASIEKETSERSIQGTRRRQQLKRFALIASERLQNITDPRP
jgi:hypothetical protein